MSKTTLEQKVPKKMQHGCDSCCTVSTSGPLRPPPSGPHSALIPHPQQGPMQKILVLSMTRTILEQTTLKLQLRMVVPRAALFPLPPSRPAVSGPHQALLPQPQQGQCKKILLWSMTKTILEQADQKIATKNGSGSCCTVSTSGPSRPPISDQLPALLPQPQQEPSAKNLGLINDQCHFGTKKTKNCN